MKRPMFLLFAAVVALLITASAPAAGNRPLSPELQKLNISVGRWVYHGKTLKTATAKAGTWTWNADCRWSPDRMFLECSFDNVWSGKAIKSLVVDTYNPKDQTYWHYEMFAEGASGAHPFVSRMTIHGNTWVEYGQDEEHGRKVHERIVYRYASTSRVSVAIQISRDGTHWTTIDQGEGVKQP